MGGLAHLPTPAPNRGVPRAKLSPHENVNLRVTFPEKNACTKCNLYLHVQIIALSFEYQIPTPESGQSAPKNLLSTLVPFSSTVFPQKRETTTWGT